ncbi:hypothetical protein [Sulfolobus spindle-shaped virus]|nr:hypothetical protein [Sulfolobus spindle-shaped virus]
MRISTFTKRFANCRNVLFSRLFAYFPFAYQIFKERLYVAFRSVLP